MVVVVVIDDVDGGCADVVVGDVAMLRGMPECVSRVCVAVSMVLGVTWELKSTWAFFSAVGPSSSSDSVCRAAL